MKLKDIAELLNAQLYLPPSREQDRLSILAQEFASVAPLHLAQAHHLSFLTNPKYKTQLGATKAGVVLLAQSDADVSIPQLIHHNPYAAMAKIAALMFSYTHSFKGQSPLAYVEEGATIDSEATLFPFSYVSSGARIGKGSVLYPHCFVGSKTEIGENCVLFPNVVVMDHCKIGAGTIIHGGTVIGADGFGFSPSPEGLLKIPQTGAVHIAEQVEIGALCTIDRATFEATQIGTNSKLDSHVHVGHNVKVGSNSMLCAQVGIAGSSTIGNQVIMAGQAGVAPSIHIADGVTLGARCGAISDIELAGEYQGMPQTPSRDWARQVAVIIKLPDLYKRMGQLEKQLEQLKSEISSS